MDTPEISIDDLSLSFEVGESVVEEFAQSHTPTDILRELVQNEYDARGTEISVHFGNDKLVITGNGNPIDAAGWKRLRVMLGTGLIPGSNVYVTPKKSSIGSKNFGLRSLFTISDAIWVTSGGKWSVLHCRKGALPSPREAQDSPQRGVRIEVPYRQDKDGALEPFTPEKRREWIREISGSLAETLIKLSHPGQSQSLHRVVLKADGMPEVAWTQRAKEIPTPAKGIQLIERRAVRETAGQRKSIVELEYRARVRIPEAYRGKDFPTYFKSGNNVWVGVSLRLDRGRPDTSSMGLVYYPLSAPLARTGNRVSLNAPFDLDNNRANIVSPLSNSWNEWLIRQLVELTIRLLPADWYERFGAGAYLALEPSQRESTNHLIEAYTNAIANHLRNEEAWASRERSRGKVIFVAANELALPDKPDFDGFLGLSRCLDVKLAMNKRVVDLSSECGAQRFGPDSLVRLRCAGEDATGTRTHPKDHGQGAWYFTDYDWQIRQHPMQMSFAQALDKVRLTADHKADLLNSVTTLAADSSLHALSEPLHVVPSDVWEACPVPLSQRLHPDLAGFKALARLAKKFDLTDWIRSTARRTRNNEVSDEERHALMNVILSRQGRFDAGTLRILLGSPILLDHHGQWVEPRKITVRRAKGAKALAPVLSFAAPSYAKDAELARRLSFRTAVDGNDLVNLAEWVSVHPDAPNQFEDALLEFRRAVRPAQWRRLGEIECLRSSNGSLATPQNLYIRTSEVLEVLGNHASYVEGSNRALYEQMGCKTLPLSSDIADAIEQNRSSSNPTPDALYTALVVALRRERCSVKTYADEAIIWTGKGYASPSDTLVTLDPGLFGDAVAIVRQRSGKATEALRALGCRMRPIQEDWVQLIASISQSTGTNGTVLESDRRRLLRAYTELPNGIPDDSRLTRRSFVLGRDSHLHEPSRIFIDDYPQLAELFAPSVPFVEDSNQAALRFYASCGVRRLSEIAILLQSKIGNAIDAPNRIGVTKTKRQLNSASFRSSLLALAKREMADRHEPTTTGLKANRLPRIETLTFVDSISREYRLGSTRARIPINYYWAGVSHLVVATQSRTAFRDAVSYALAEAVSDSPRTAQMLASAIYRLLECDSSEEIAEFLANRGIPWQRDVESEVWGEETDSEGLGEHPRIDDESIAEHIRASLQRASLSKQTNQSGTSTPTPPNQPNTAESKPQSRVLPPIGDVVATEIPSSGTPIAIPVGGSGGGGVGGGWTPPDPEWDHRLGERGEEIVYLQEVKRLREAGYESPEALVCWVARDNPTADHDIRSVAEDGDTLWIEVKSTSGSDGNFDWPESEVAKAMAEPEHYVLCRVYRVNSTNPLVKRFPNPLSMIELGRMRLGLGSVRAQVEPAGNQDTDASQ